MSAQRGHEKWKEEEQNAQLRSPRSTPAMGEKEETKGSERTIPLLRSCERCRRRKQRCDGQQPVCGRCASHGADCSYRQSGRFRKRFPRNRSGSSSSNSAAAAAAAATEIAIAAKEKAAHSTMPAASAAAAIPTGLPTAESLLSAYDMAEVDIEVEADAETETEVPRIMFTVASEGAWAESDPTPDDPMAIDPLAVLRTHEIPDLAQGLTEPLAQQLTDMIGGLTVKRRQPHSTQGKLVPNRALLDPRNAASNTTGQYAAALAESDDWLRSDDPLACLAEHDALGFEAADAAADAAEAADAVALATLHGIAQRHALPGAAYEMLELLRTSFADAESRMRTRQFWATLRAGTAGDFAALAHVAVAARDAQLAALERACFAAARREWDAGRVASTTGAVYSLLLLSDYAFQTGRTAALWDYACHALGAVRRIRLRGHAYPWVGAGTGACDVELEHLLACFWCAWARVFAAALRLTRRINERDNALPPLPLHNECLDAAMPLPDAVSGAVRFGSAPCRRPTPPHTDDAYMAATWRCCLLALPAHNCHVDLLQRRCPPARFLDVLRIWDDRTRVWRATWHPAWESRLAAILNVSRAADLAPPLAPADSWLVVLALMCATLRLRLHRAALTLLLHPDEHSLAPLPPIGDMLTGDVLLDDIHRHRCHFVCLEAANDLQELLAACGRIELPLERFGVWVVFVLEQLAAVHTARIVRRSRNDSVPAAQLDAVRRLAVAMRHLVALRRWTAALYVFTSVVKAILVEDDAHMTLPPGSIPAAHLRRIEASPWPQLHVLTMLIRELDMEPRQFCAFTVPVVYASLMTPSAPIHSSGRMRIASLLS
ncbi:hypothetical protein IWW48_005652 [Coemansia sp. RSA 1200]|nr:hypothetical protein IWW48_005652 [Coemansia sp. RSA 1200]